MGRKPSSYVGAAQRDRAQEWVKEHVGEIPDTSVSVKQFSSIAEAKKEEAKIIKEEQPKYNEERK